MKRQLILLLVFLLHLSSPVTIFSDGIIKENSNISFHGYSNSATGLVGRFAGFKKKNAPDSVKLTNTKQGLIVSTFGFNTTNQPDSLRLQSLTDAEVDPFKDVEPAIDGNAFVYPNPFRFTSSKGAKLAYAFSKPMSIEIHIYNVMAQMIVKKTIESGAPGAQYGVLNKISIQDYLLGGKPLSAGVYFYLIINEGHVLARGKMAVKP